MYQSPRERRLRNDLAALERLRSESSVFRFTSLGDPPVQYRIQFLGRGLWRDRGKVRILEKHHIEIKLGSSYPRAIPEIRWLSPIYHPNISEIGMVCLGGYGTHWVPSVQLDDLCTMLWDMLRYHNYDIRSPYNRDAALWVAQQQTFGFPTEDRSIRDLRVSLGRVPTAVPAPSAASKESARGLGRVRRFAERYGRVFGSRGDEGERRLPSHPELEELVTAQSAAERPLAPVDEPLYIIEPDSHEPGSVTHEDEVPRVIGAGGPAARAEDEIVFIE